MKKNLTTRELQTADFAESLYKSLRKKAEKLLDEQESILSKTSGFLEDGLTEDECSELLIIEEGISREASLCYIDKVKSNYCCKDGLHEYSYSFEDTSGRVWSSFDINRNVYASSEEDAWTKISEALDEAEEQIDFDHIISVDRLDRSDDLDNLDDF